jgi:hypothetical protein
LTLLSHDWFILDKQSTGLCLEYQSVLGLCVEYQSVLRLCVEYQSVLRLCVEYQRVLRLSQYKSRGIAALDLLIFGTKFNPLKPSGYFMYHLF